MTEAISLNIPSAPVTGKVKFKQLLNRAIGAAMLLSILIGLAGLITIFTMYFTH